MAISTAVVVSAQNISYCSGASRPCTWNHGFQAVEPGRASSPKSTLIKPWFNRSEGFFDFPRNIRSHKWREPMPQQRLRKQTRIWRKSVSNGSISAGPIQRTVNLRHVPSDPQFTARTRLRRNFVEEPSPYHGNRCRDLQCFIMLRHH